VGDAQLLQQASLVDVNPAFGYLVFGDSEEAHPGKRHVSTGWCDAHEVTLVGTATRPAYYHLVSFGHYLLYRILDVWKGAAVHADVVLELFEPALLLAGQVVDEVSAKYLVCRVEITSAEKVLEPAACERLVLFGYLSSSLSCVVPHQGARAQSSARRGLGTHLPSANFQEDPLYKVRRIHLLGRWVTELAPWSWNSREG
jgi:hypothetical protein